MKTCNGDQQLLQQKMDYIVEHYKGNHNECNLTSLCSIDNPYIPMIIDDEAERILVSYIRSLTIYKEARSYGYTLYGVI